MKVVHGFQAMASGLGAEQVVVTQMLRLGNKSNNPIAFKVCERAELFNEAIKLKVRDQVKTTAPKQYCVRPNSGRFIPL